MAIVLPAYNEQLTIAATIEAFNKALPDASIVVVNNNSKDATETIARDTIARLGCSGVVLNEFRQGKGNAVRRAFLDIDADAYLMSDADMTYPASHAVALLGPVLAGDADMVVGDRLSNGDYARENKRNFHRFGNNLIRHLVNSLFSASLTDIMSGYRAFSRRFVKTYPILVEGFEVETDVTLHALDKRLRIVEVPIEYVDRPEGSVSKLNTLSDGTRVLLTIARILRHYKPLAFFGGLGIAMSLCGLLAGYPVLQDWIEHRYIYHVPLAVLAAALEIGAIVVVGVGLTLDSIVHHSKLSFELIRLSQRADSVAAPCRERVQ